MNRFRFLTVFLFVLCSCSSENRQLNKEFSKTIRLESQKIEINEIIKPGLILVLDDYLVIQNEYTPNHDCFFVYSLDAYKFLYSFGRLGSSPNEFIAHRLIQNSTDNILSIFDQASRYIHNFRLTDTAPILMDKHRIEDGCKQPFQEFSYLNDSIILVLRHDHTLCSYNIREGRFLDELVIKTDIKTKSGEGYNPSMESFHFSNYKDKIVVGHQFINSLSVGKIENGRFLFDNKELTSTEINKSMLQNNVYYLYVSTTSEHIFAQYYGLPFMQMQPFPINMGKRIFKFYLEVYDWDLKPLVLLEFDSDMLRCAIDEKTKTIYTWNPLDDFDYLLVYKFKTY